MWINRISTVLHETERYMQWTLAIPNIKYKVCAIQTKIPKFRLHSIQNMLKFQIIEHDILSWQNIEYYQSRFGRQVLETGGNGWKTLLFYLFFWSNTPISWSKSCLLHQTEFENCGLKPYISLRSFGRIFTTNSFCENKIFCKLVFPLICFCTIFILISIVR